MGMEVVRTFKPQRQDPADGMDDQQAVTGGATLNSHYLSSNPSSMLGFSRVIAVIYIYIYYILRYTYYMWSSPGLGWLINTPFTIVICV